jgi:hypothetical protein
MEPIILQQVVDCPGATIRNDALQPVNEPILTVTLKAWKSGIVSVDYLLDFPACSLPFARALDRYSAPGRSASDSEYADSIAER